MKPSKNILKSSFWSVVAQIPAHVFGILAGVFITRLLGPEGKGVVTLFTTNTDLFATIFGFSIINSIIYFTANKSINHKRVKKIITLLLSSTIILSISVSCLWLNTQFDYLLFSEELQDISYYLMFIIGIFIITLNAVFTSYFQGLRLFNISNKALIFNGFISLIIFSGMFILSKVTTYYFSIFSIIVASLIILLLNTVYWLFHYAKLHKHYTPEDTVITTTWKQDLKAFWKFTSYNHLANSLMFFNNKLIIWIFVFHLDNWKLGIFSLGLGLAQLLSFFTNPISIILESFLNSQDTTNKEAIFARILRIQFSMILLIALTAYFLAPSLIPWIYGREFFGAVKVMQIISFGVLFSNQSTLMISYLLTKHWLKYYVIAAVIGIVITIIAAPIFIVKLGTNGAALIQVYTYVGIYLILLTSIRAKEKLPMNIYIITKEDWKFIKLQIAKRSNRD